MVTDIQPLHKEGKKKAQTSLASARTKPGKDTQTSIAIISKTGTLSEEIVEPESDTTIEKLTILLSKKCGNRNHDGFSCYHTWKYKNKKNFEFTIHNNKVIPKYIYIDVWGKPDGRAGSENKYEMPPPIDELIFYGNIALVARVDKETAINITVGNWDIIYEKLFGGFEDLEVTALEDENEIDELDTIPADKKTRNGYFKDGFVIEDDSEETTPRCKKYITARNSSHGGKGKKNKSESTESEFITETETESCTPPSDSPLNSDIDAEIDTPVIKPNINRQNNSNTSGPTKLTRIAIANAKKPVNAKSKKGIEDLPISPESETELSEEEYV
jgi:hypothetical protein